MFSKNNKIRNRSFKVGITAIFAVFVLLSQLVLADPSKKVSESIILQGFGWNSQARGVPSKWYQLIEKRADSIKELGVNFVWFPPVSRSVSPQGYLPGDYYDVGTNSNPTFYGNQDQLKNALNSLNQRGISPVADIVINHRCAGKQDSNGIWNQYYFASKKAEWGEWAVCSGEYGGTGRPDTGINYGAAPDIDHTNSKVREDISEWMMWLKGLGFKAWRYDFSKGYSAEYAGIYDNNTAPAFSVGEVWTNMSYNGSEVNYDQDSHRQQLCNWLDENKSPVACVFDFTTKGILQEAVKGQYWRLKDKDGSPSGLIGWWPQRAVTFIDNHDTGSQQSHWPFPGEQTMQGYAYILTHPGIPCLFWEHVYDWNLYPKIQKLVAVRKGYKLNSRSKVKIIKAEEGLYAAVIDDKVAVKLGCKDWNPGSEFKLHTSGNNYAVWGVGLKK